MNKGWAPQDSQLTLDKAAKMVTPTSGTGTTGHKVFRHEPATFRKNKLRKILNLNVKCKSRKLLGDKIESPEDLEFGHDFLALTPKARSMKEVIDKPDSIKGKTFLLYKTKTKPHQKNPQKTTKTIFTL